MAVPDMSHRRDPVEIWKLAWDETNQVLRTSATINISGGIEVSINHIDDSIAIGDGAASNRKAGVNTDFELLSHDEQVKLAVEDVETAVGALLTPLADIETSVDNLQTPLADIETAVDAVTVAVTDVETAVDAVNTSVGTSNGHLSDISTDTGNIDSKLTSVLAKLPYKLGVDFDEIDMALSSGDTVETWTYKLATAFVFKVILTYEDDTREVLTSVDYSVTP